MLILCFCLTFALQLQPVFLIHLTSTTLPDTKPNTTSPPQPPVPTGSQTISQLQIIQSIYKSLLTDKQVKKLLDKNDTDSSEFKKLMFSKVRESIRSNLSVLQYLSHRVFDSSNLSLSQNQKQQLLQAFLNDKDLTELFSNGKQDSEQGKKEIIKKVAEMYKNNPLLRIEIAGKVFEKSNLELNSEEKAELFQILIESEKAVMSDQALGNKDVDKIVETVEKNEKLKGMTKENEDRLRAFVKGL